LKARWPRALTRSLVGLVLLAVFVLPAIPSEANLADEIKKLEEEREQVQANRAAKAEQVEVASAEADALADALAVLSLQVNEQEGQLAEAEAALEEADRTWALATQAVLDTNLEIEGLIELVQTRAVAAYVRAGVGTTPVLEPSDPNEAVRMQSLVSAVTEAELDVSEQLRVAREDLAFEEARADAAAQEADQLRAEIAEQLVRLEEAKAAQQQLVIDAEARYEARLAEAQYFAQVESDLAEQITEKNEELQRQLALAARKNNPAAGQNIPGFPTADELEKVDVFWVHEDIADDLRALLDAARADGVVLKGWGYRSHQRQIELRRAHCGTSDYAVWQKPSSQCRPPTARPGASMHERGLAIDFTLDGRAINSRSSPGYIWLSQHASKYGLYNLPSEPWHWSVNGN
jgi:LAS superfamily LD-carboxypeptidase LdcB